MNGEATNGNDFNTLVAESLCGGLGCIASDCTDLEALGQGGVGQNGSDDGTALNTGRAKDGEELCHDE